MTQRNGKSDKLSLYIFNDALGGGVWADCPELEFKTIGDTESEALEMFYKMAKTKANAIVQGEKDQSLMDFQMPMLPYAKTLLRYKQPRYAFVRK